MVHLTLWCMMDHNDNSKSLSPSGSIDMQHLIKPRGKGYSLRMLTPPVLVGTTNPWTDKPFGKEIKLGLRTRTHAEALRIRDVRVGQIRQLEADAIAASGRGGIGRILDLSPEAAEEWRKMRLDATDEEREGYDYVPEDQLEAAADAGKEREAFALGALVFKGAVPLEKALEQYLDERKEGNVFGFDPLAVTTALNVRSTMKHLLEFLDMEAPLLQDVTPERAFQFRTQYLPIEKGLGVGTVTKHVNFMRVLWNWAIVDKMYLKSRKVPARVHTCSLKDARKIALEDNSKVRLAMSATERQDAAWRLVMMREDSAFLYSKREIVALGLVSDGQVGVMRRTYRQLAGLGDGIPDTWSEAAGRDKHGAANGDWDAEGWIEARAAVFSDKVGKLIGDEFEKCPDAAVHVITIRAGRQGCRVLLDHLDAVAVGDTDEEIGLLAYALGERLTSDEIEDLALQAKAYVNPPF